jgi:mutator protein MutT
LNTEGPSHPVIHVVAGVVIDSAGRALIAQRPAGKHLAGEWEFPGGKLEPGEHRLAGLARELREEIGIDIRTPRPLIRVRHTYPYGDVLLDVWVVRYYSGEPRGLDGQALRWCAKDELAQTQLLPADRPIVRALRLPERLMRDSSADYRVTEIELLAASVDRLGDAGETQLRGSYCANTEEAARAARAGADFLVMRAAVPRQQLAALCESLPLPVFALGMTLEAAWALGATGVNDVAP